RELASQDYPDAVRELVEYHAKEGHVHDLRAYAASDPFAAQKLCECLGGQLRDTDDASAFAELQELAARGSSDAVHELVEYHSRRGHVDDLRAYAEDGHPAAQERLAECLGRQLNERRGSRALREMRQLARQGRLDAVRELADYLYRKRDLDGMLA